MFFDQRVIFSDNSVLTDLSASLNDFRAGTSTILYTTAQDYIYIASRYPWCAKYIEIGTANDVAATMTVEVYESPSTWRSVVDKIDMTAVTAGTPLGQSGYVRFQTNRLYSWTPLQDSADILTGTAIYDMYWLRISFSATLKATMSLKYIGHKFSSDDDLYERYPEFNQTALKTQFESGKSTWDDQHYIAVEQIVGDLKNRRVILNSDNLLDPWEFKEAAIHKVASIIYTGFGKSYVEAQKAADAKYSAVMDRRYPKIDRSLDGLAQPEEMRFRIGRLTR